VAFRDLALDAGEIIFGRIHLIGADEGGECHDDGCQHLPVEIAAHGVLRAVRRSGVGCYCTER
jgi:hypothetical protein